MGQLRRKVHNYTILVLIKEGSMPDFHVKSLAALRVREGEEVDSLCFQDCDQKERQAIAKDMKALHAFLADDLILTADISENMPAMESYIRNTAMPSSRIPRSISSPSMKR